MSAAPVPFSLAEELLPAPDPWETARRFAHLPHLLFLDSADRHVERGRYSFVAADPVDWISKWDRDPFLELRDRLAAFSMATIPHLPPFQGGLAGQFGYGLQHVIERLPRARTDEFHVPDLGVGMYDWTIAWDHEVERCWLISTGFPETGVRRRERAAARMAEVKRELSGDKSLARRTWTGQRPVATELLSRQTELPAHPSVTSNFDRASYIAAVRRAIEYVHAGDCFQVNLSQRLLAPLAEHPLELYGRLRRGNPAPFAGYLDMGEFAIASASPERFLRVVNGAVQSRPIKGTRPRGVTASAERDRIAELTASAKDRAENVMIVDLLRNDLGRVCAYGSVRVPKVCQVETYRYVHHLVSEVCGQLAPGRSPMDLLRACFPGGSVTGAPKVRAMEIIAELEPTARGPYCGCLGYIGFDGSMDTSILIRTFTAGGGYAQFPVGGGIVADSNPEREYQETLDKARGMLNALVKDDCQNERQHSLRH